MNRYPLTWPEGWRRTNPGKRVAARFSKGERTYSSAPGESSWLRRRDLSIADGVGRVIDALRRFGVLEGDAIISTNVPTRLDGLPRSDARKPEDPGVAVYWERPGDQGKTKVMAIDAYIDVAHNLAAIAATLEAMRAIERHGGAIILDRAFQGFAALPAPGQIHRRNWREVLGVDAGVESLTLVRQQYRSLASRAHPDKPGGSHEAMTELNQALVEAEEALG